MNATFFLADAREEVRAILSRSTPMAAPGFERGSIVRCFTFSARLLQNAGISLACIANKEDDRGNHARAHRSVLLQRLRPIGQESPERQKVIDDYRQRFDYLAGVPNAIPEGL